jgi:hypothetical protein
VILPISSGSVPFPVQSGHDSGPIPATHSGVNRPPSPDEFVPPTRAQVSELVEKLDVVALETKNVLLAVLGIGALILLLRIFK